jgi:hypothetical protein
MTDTGTTKVQVRTCRCGHARGHHMVSDEPEYTFIGWVAMLVGISARPTLVKWRCRRCHELFDRSADPTLLATHY